MAQANGRSVHDIVTDGSQRTLQDLNGKGTVAVSIPKEYVEDHDLEIGEPVAIMPSDTQNDVLEIHLDTDD